jgi:hypothetical protein
MQNFRDIHIIGVFSVYLALAFPISPIIFSVLAILLMATYIWLFYKTVYVESSRMIRTSSTDIFINTNIPKGYYVFLLRILLVILTLSYVLLFIGINYDYILFLVLIFIFSIIQFFAFSFMKKNNSIYFILGKDSIEGHIDYTNRIYFVDLKQIKVNSLNYNFISQNGNEIKFNLDHYSNEFRIKVLNRVEEISKLFNVDLSTPVG